MKQRTLTTLAIECSTSACSVALAGDTGLRAFARAEARGQSEALIPLIGEVLTQSGLDWGAVGLIAVTVGPGSFTGVRIGLAAARGLALARNLPVAGITTTDLVAAMAGPGRALLAAVDSKREEVFVQAFAADLQPLGPIEALTPQEALARHGEALLVAGDATERFTGVETRRITPDAQALAELARRRFTEGRALPPQPVYIRPPDVTVPAR